MEIKKENRLYKTFIWCLGIVGKFMGKDLDWEYRKYKEQTNLCHFVRVICLQAPLVILLNLIAYATVSSVFILPFFLFTMSGLGKVLLIILIVGSVICLLTGVLWYILNKFTGYEIRNTELWKVSTKYIESIHKHICPFITFK